MSSQVPLLLACLLGDLSTGPALDDVDAGQCMLVCTWRQVQCAVSQTPMFPSKLWSTKAPQGVNKQPHQDIMPILTMFSSVCQLMSCSVPCVPLLYLPLLRPPHAAHPLPAHHCGDARPG